MTESSTSTSSGGTRDDPAYAALRGLTVCVTGGAGFIGSHLTRELLRCGATVVAVDSLVPFYDPAVKQARVAAIEAAALPGAYTFVRADLADRAAFDAVLARHRPAVVCHLAAQPGVRWCESHPDEAERSNVVAMRAVVDAAEAAPSVRHLVFASSSSVYGRQPGPWGEELPTRPTGRYAASKAAGEVLCKEAAARGRVAVTILRLFSVYGPDGRPDMAPLAFTEMVYNRRPVTIFGDGAHARDFTHVSDVVDAFLRCAGAEPPAAAAGADAPVYNVGGGSPCTVLELLDAIERALGRRAVRQHLEARPEDVPTTHSRTGKLRAALGWQPRVNLERGVDSLVRWYLATRPEAVASAAAPGKWPAPQSSRPPHACARAEGKASSDGENDDENDKSPVAPSASSASARQHQAQLALAPPVRQKVVGA